MLPLLILSRGENRCASQVRWFISQLPGSLSALESRSAVTSAASAAKMTLLPSSRLRRDACCDCMGRFLSIFELLVVTIRPRHRAGHSNFAGAITSPRVRGEVGAHSRALGEGAYPRV